FGNIKLSLLFRMKSHQEPILCPTQLRMQYVRNWKSAIKLSEKFDLIVQPKTEIYIMKILIPLVIIIFASCNNHKQQNMNEKIVKQYFEHFNNHEWTEMANMYAETSEFKDPSLGQGIVKQTRQQIIAKYSQLNEFFPD